MLVAFHTLSLNLSASLQGIIPILQVILKLKNIKQAPKVMQLMKVAELTNLTDFKATVVSEF